MARAIPADFPPVLYVPCAKSVVDLNEAEIDMRVTRDGRIALLAYSALDRLHTCCGDQQPWVLLPVTSLDEIQKTQPFSLLLLDVVVPPDRRRVTQ